MLYPISLDNLWKIKHLGKIDSSFDFDLIKSNGIYSCYQYYDSIPNNSPSVDTEGFLVLVFGIDNSYWSQFVVSTNYSKILSIRQYDVSKLKWSNWKSF